MSRGKNTSNKKYFLLKAYRVDSCFSYLNENVGVAHHYEQGFGSRDGHIEALGVGQEPQYALEVFL